MITTGLSIGIVHNKRQRIGTRYIDINRFGWRSIDKTAAGKLVNAIDFNAKTHVTT